MSQLFSAQDTPLPPILTFPPLATTVPHTTSKILALYIAEFAKIFGEIIIFFITLLFGKDNNKLNYNQNEQGFTNL